LIGALTSVSLILSSSTALLVCAFNLVSLLLHHRSPFFVALSVIVLFPSFASLVLAMTNNHFPGSKPELQRMALVAVASGLLALLSSFADQAALVLLSLAGCVAGWLFVTFGAFRTRFGQKLA
jgi:low temperature requirement protein LtrA